MRAAREASHVLLIGLALLATASAAASASPVIPWLDQRPAKATAHPPLAPPCRSRDLRAHLFLQGATGTLVGGVDLRNAGASPCALLGRPQISFTGGAAANEPWRVKKIARSPEPLEVLADPLGSLRALAPGKSARITLYWSNWCGTPPDELRIRLADRSSLVVPLAQAPRCDLPQDPSLLAVAPFTPTARTLPSSSHVPLATAIIGPRPVLVKPGLHAFRVRRGALLSFRVALTNGSKTVFHFARSSCPAFIEELWPAVPQPYVLNCRRVGAIAPHDTVLFEMQIPIPAGARLGNTLLTWELAPKTHDPPSASAAVWVVR
jgi:Protein of unknown function (DUF4232)